VLESSENQDYVLRKVLQLRLDDAKLEAKSFDPNTTFTGNHRFAPTAGRWQMGVDCEWNV
jgi:hypothetical protein